MTRRMEINLKDQMFIHDKDYDKKWLPLNIEFKHWLVKRDRLFFGLTMKTSVKYWI